MTRSKSPKRRSKSPKGKFGGTNEYSIFVKQNFHKVRNQLGDNVSSVDVFKELGKLWNKKGSKSDKDLEFCVKIPRKYVQFT